MLKGCQKNVIMLRGTESEIFEEAFFILKKDIILPNTIPNNDMINEAKRILAANSSESNIKIKYKKKKCAVYFAAGAVSSLCLCAIIGVLILAI